MRRSARKRNPVVHYGDVETYASENVPEDEIYSSLEYLPPRILPLRSCNIRNDTSSKKSFNTMGSNLSREKREVLKQIDINFKFDSYAELQNVLLQILSEIIEHEFSWPFLEPVSKEVPYYYSIILNPIDLSTIRSKIHDFSYSCEDSFFDDLNLMFENCKTFNEPGTDIFKAGVYLKKFVAKLRIIHFPGWEDVDLEDIIIDRATRQKPIIDNKGHVIIHGVSKPQMKIEGLKHPTEDPRFAVSSIFPKYLSEFEFDRTNVQQSSSLLEIATFFSLLCTTPNFYLVGNENFSLSSLERAFIVPHQSSLFLSLNFLLIAKVTEIRNMRKIFTIPSVDMNGLTDEVNAEILGSQFHIGKLLGRIFDKFTYWNKTRNRLREDLNAILCGENNVSSCKLEQIRIELAFYNVLLFTFSTHNEKEFNEFSSKNEVSVYPFEDINSYIALDVLERIDITKALISWRFAGYQDLNIYNALRQHNVDSLTQSEIGSDFLGNKYYYFPQFFNECRIYKLTLSLEEQFNSFQGLLLSFEDPSDLKRIIKDLKMFEEKHYVDESEKVYDLREVKAKLKRKLVRRDNSSYLTGLCKEMVILLKENKTIKLKQANREGNNCLYDSVHGTLLPLFGQVIPPLEFPCNENDSKNLDIAGPEVNSAVSVEDDQVHNAVKEDLKRKRATSDISDSSSEGSQPEVVISLSKTSDSRMDDIIYDGSTYIPIRRSARTRKSVKRFEITYGNVQSSSRKPKVRITKKSITNLEASDLVKKETQDIQSIIFELKIDAFESFLHKKCFEEELAVYRFLKAKFALSDSLPAKPISWQLLCKSPEEIQVLVSSLISTRFRKKSCKDIVTALENIEQNAKKLIKEQGEHFEREQRKQVQAIQFQNNARKRSSRIQQEQVKLDKIRKAEEFERLREIRKECAVALWKEYSRKRRNKLNRERRVLRIEHQRAIELEKQIIKDKKRNDESLNQQHVAKQFTKKNFKVKYTQYQYEKPLHKSQKTAYFSTPGNAFTFYKDLNLREIQQPFFPSLQQQVSASQIQSYTPYDRSIRFDPFGTAWNDNLFSHTQTLAQQEHVFNGSHLMPTYSVQNTSQKNHPKSELNKRPDEKIFDNNNIS